MAKSRKSYWMIEADAEERRKKFEQILHEHEEIVMEISHQAEEYEEEEEKEKLGT